MPAKTRPNIACWNPQFTPTKFSKFPNLLVSGCSYSYNTSESEIITWPYYLKFLLDFEEVYDCSQSGAGNNHIFNSIINEVETNNNINQSNTLIIIVWSGMSRSDTIADTTISNPWHPMSNYNFNSNFSTLSLFKQLKSNKTELEKLCRQYELLISPYAQAYESCLKIIALHYYLTAKSYNFIFLPWEKFTYELLDFNDIIPNITQSLMEQSLSVGEFAELHNMRIPGDGHPTTEAHLQWANKHLVPLLESKNLIK